MNKIININLAGRLIPIDEQAYDILSRYLSGLKQFFSREEGGAEILHDMEDRIGELFQDKIKRGAAAISTKDVEAMIAIMGRPEQIMGEAGEETAAPEDQNATQKEHSGGTGADKHLSRSSQEKVIGGVCGGIAAYFNIDPAIVRVIFALVSFAWGTGVLIYILLWILLPLKDTQPDSLRRRLYRNEDQKVIGGVCGGIGAYLNIDPIWLRLIFILPIISGVGFGLFHHYFLPFTFGGVPSMILLYLILWIALPKATTLTEKLEMSGKKVDVKNLSHAVKQTGSAAPADRKSGSHVFAVLLKIIAFFIGGIILITMLSVLGALVFSFFRLGTSLSGLSLGSLVTDVAPDRWLLYGSLFLVLAIPLYVLIRVMIYLISGRPQKSPKWWRISLVILFIAGVFSLFWVIGNVAGDFNVRYHKTETVDFPPIPEDTVFITQRYSSGPRSEGVEQVWDNDDWNFHFLNDTALAIQNVSIHIARSPDSLFHLEVERSAYGKNSDRAKALALPLTFDYHREGNRIYLPKASRIPATNPFRGQAINATILVPDGKVFYLDDVNNWSWSRRSYGFSGGRFHFEQVTRTDYDEETFYKMRADGSAEDIGSDSE